MSNDYVHVVNMTNFFNRELYMHSLGDIKFRKPVSLKKVAYITLFLVVWCVPIVVFFGLQFNVFYLAILLGPPLLLGNFAAKPVWGGRGLLDFLKTLANFAGQPRGWADLAPAPKLDQQVFFTEHEVWISRRREMALLADMTEEEDRASGLIRERGFRGRKKK